MNDSLDLICDQIVKVVRTDREDCSWYAAQLRDGSWVHFHEMNPILQRFIFSSTHCKRSYVDFTGQTQYER